MRNLILGAEFVMSHVTHFYHLAILDYAEGPNMPPWTPTNSSWTGQIFAYLRRQADLPRADRINLAGAGYTALDGIWDNAIVDYLVALRVRREILNAAGPLAGRTPQIKNLLVGGIGQSVTTDQLNELDAVLGADGTVGTALDFIINHYVPLTHIVSYVYAKLDNSNNNTGATNALGNPPSVTGRPNNGEYNANLLSFGVFNNATGHASTGNPDRLIKRGVILNDVNGGTGVVDITEDMIKEYIPFSHYDTDSVVDASGVYDDDAATGGLQPWSGYTDPASGNGYSWLKAPRIVYGGSMYACQVGPLARMTVTGARGSSITPASSGAGNATIIDTEAGHYRLGDAKNHLALVLGHRSIGPILSANTGTLASVFGALPDTTITCGTSLMDRHRARAYECYKIAKAMKNTWIPALRTLISGNYSKFTSWSMPSGTVYGRGMQEAPRGALSHWVKITDGVIDNYQCVVPSTWNNCPKTGSGIDKKGPVEQNIMNSKLADTSNTAVPLEVLRVIHSFDPCIACAVH